MVFLFSPFQDPESNPVAGNTFILATSTRSEFFHCTGHCCLGGFCNAQKKQLFDGKGIPPSPLKQLCSLKFK